MAGGYAYGDLEPKERCPYCGAMCCADFVDIGVGFQQCGPFHCERCRASEIGPNDEPRALTKQEEDFGWYAPGSQHGSSANVDDNGNHLCFFEADSLYRQSVGVAPRYDRNGRLLP